MLPTELFRSIATTIARSWQSLVAADILYKLLAFSVLMPLFVVLFHSVLTLTGQGVLSDVDIALFFAGPVGWICAIAFGAIWLTIMALEQATLLCIMAARAKGRRISVTAALQFTLQRSWNVLMVTARLIGWSLAILTPFLLIAGAVYLLLLSEYDINYYLNERPSEFRLAVAMGVGLAVLLTGVLLRLYSGWFLALPMVLFDQVPPGEVLAESRKLVSGNRRTLLVWLVTWGCTVVAVNIMLTAVIGGVGQLLIPSSVGSLPLLATRIGLMLMVLAVGGLIINLFATIALAGLLFHGYQKIHPQSAVAIDVVALADDSGARSRQLITRNRLLAAGLCGATAAATIGYWSLNSVRLEDEVQVMAHRGASTAAPENTMAAFRQAISDGADWIELDVQETADGEVVVVHDSDFMKLSKNPLKIWDAKLADLASIDIGTWFAADFSNERVPTLAEVLRLCKDQIRVNIELKYYGHDQQLEQRVVDIVEAEGMAQQIVVMSLKPEGIAKTKALRPDWKCGLLLSVYVGNMQNITADFLAVNATFATRNFVKRAHKAGKDVFVWTVNDAATMSQMLNRKVDGILTDRPQLARQVLKQRSEMSNAERLLTEISVVLNQPGPVPEQ
jgi:glycerophosphoryl diester phosphodiesterase